MLRMLYLRTLMFVLEILADPFSPVDGSPDISELDETRTARRESVARRRATIVAILSPQTPADQRDTVDIVAASAAAAAREDIAWESLRRYRGP